MANNLTIEKKTMAVNMLVEGNSIRGIERMTGVHRDTIMRLGVRVGEGMRKVQDELFTNLSAARIEMDEMWGFIGAKDKIAKKRGLKEKGMGDVWTWVALDADSKLVPSWHVGDRGQEAAEVFVGDLKKRLVNRPQITTDAHAAYKIAIEKEFGMEVDYGSLVKVYRTSSGGAPTDRGYSPPQVESVKKSVVQGNPDKDLISTSYVEKQNHTMRMHCRRLARLTNAFSKKRENFEAAVSLHFAYYNLVKSHKTIKCTPAMEAGVAQTFWSVRDLVEQGEDAAKAK